MSYKEDCKNINYDYDMGARIFFCNKSNVVPLVTCDGCVNYESINAPQIVYNFCCDSCINSRKIISENGFHSICCLSPKKSLDCKLNRHKHFVEHPAYRKEDCK